MDRWKVKHRRERCEGEKKKKKRERKRKGLRGNSGRYGRLEVDPINVRTH